MRPEVADPATDDVVIDVDFVFKTDGVELVLRPPIGGRHFVGDRMLFRRLPALPAVIEFQNVPERSGIYKNLLRGFTVGPGKPQANNAFEVLSAQFARSGQRPFEWRINGVPPTTGERNPATLPWELVLYDTLDKGLIERAAVVRSLKRSEAYAPVALSEPFRTLLVQGGQSGRVVLRFDRDRVNLEQVWHDLGPELQKRIEKPTIRSVKRTELEAAIRDSCPHLLWFSGHGRASADGFSFLFDDDHEFTPIAELIPAIRAGCQGHALPLLVAFWSCESARLASEASADVDEPVPVPDATAHEQLPALVEAMATIGIEAVLGCQTRVLDGCARIMAKALFRNLAEGKGPARALAAARGELARGSLELAPGGEAEWPSPVLWTGGAHVPILRWARPRGEDEAILLDKLCYESVSKDDAAVAVWQQSPASLAPTANWIARAPCWIVYKAIGHDAFEMFESLRCAQSQDRRALLIIQVAGEDSEDFLRAFASNMRELRRRIFPGVELGETEWLMSVFALADSERRREDAWHRLLEREDLVIAVIDRGGLTDFAALNAAMARRFPIVVFSPDAIDSAGADGDTATASWNSDVFGGNNELPDWSVSEQSFFEALATFNRPLSSAAIDLFGADFEVEHAFCIAGSALVGYGGRYVLRAGLAAALALDLDDDRRRAAHLACLNFLERCGIDPGRSKAMQLSWRLEHAAALDKRAEIIDLGARTISAWRAEGNHDNAIRTYQSLKQQRRSLPLTPRLDVATAYVFTGRPQLALDVLDQIAGDLLTPREQIDVALRRAEALRNTREHAKRMQALSLLETTLALAEDLKRLHPSDRDVERVVLVVRHDLARHGLYFQGRGEQAKREYESVVAQCGDDPDRQYLKIAALRNLGDVCHRYAYGLSGGDLGTAISHFQTAKKLATSAPEALVLLPEIAYELAKALARAGQADQSERELAYALKRARRDGNALILALASNRRFWNDHGQDPTFDSAMWAEWERVERQLDAAEHHSWAARALVDTRLRAAKRRAAQAIKVLSDAREVLRRHDGLRGAADLAERWLPIYAGLAVLQANTGGPSPEAYAPSVWAQLANDCPEVTSQRGCDPVDIWNRVA